MLALVNYVKPKFTGSLQGWVKRNVLRVAHYCLILFEYIYTCVHHTDCSNITIHCDVKYMFAFIW